jgi:nucleotide-binding universal stress UspA family protein
MYESICVSLDGSKQSKKAIEIATALVKANGGRLLGLFIDPSAAEAARLARLAQALPEGQRPSLEAQRPLDVSPASYPFETKLLTGRPHKVLATELSNGRHELIVLPARRSDEDTDSDLGSLCARSLRKSHVDTLVVKQETESTSDIILVCIDGSQQSYAGLKAAIVLARTFNKRLQAVAVYDPYLHYTLFNGIVNVLTEKASSVFKFKDQEKLHEEIIDTGLAKIYQAHLEVARKVAETDGADLEITLLDGKAFEKIRQLAVRRPPWLMVMGRIGVHSAEGMDIGSTTENLLRAVPCDVLVTSRTFVPPVDVKAEASIEWTPEAKAKMERVPAFVRGVATTAILRWANERGHSVITPSVINKAMGELLPPQAAQAMGYVAEEIALQLDNMHDGITFVCPSCGWAIKNVRPAKCSVCSLSGEQLEQIDRNALAKIGKLDKGALEEEETFDGKVLSWEEEAKEVLRRVPSGYQRRRSKARIEKTAKVRGIERITPAFALDVVQQDLAETSYLSSRGETLEIEIKKDERPNDDLPKSREGSDLTWTDAAWARLCRVPEGFMREMTRERVEGFAKKGGHASIALQLCEEGIAEGRRMMAEMIGAYGYDGAAKEVLRRAAEKEGPVAKVEAKAEAHAHVHAHVQAEGHAHTGSGGGCPFHAMKPKAEVEWSPEAEAKLKTATDRVVEAKKFTEERAEELARNVAETRALESKMDSVMAGFMNKLGKQIGYGHPLSDLTAQYQFEWTPEALARLEKIPAFCRELSKWRVEWTAVKKNLGNVITPEIMDVKFDMWSEVSHAIKAGGGRTMDWAPETWARVENIPDFVQGQVIQSVEGNAKSWGLSQVTHEVLDRVIQKWVDTGDFHEGKYGYKAPS